MIKRFGRTVSLISLAFCLSAATSLAETKDYLFDVYILGLKAGELKYSVRTKGDQYSAAGKL